MKLKILSMCSAIMFLCGEYTVATSNFNGSDVYPTFEQAKGVFESNLIRSASMPNLRQYEPMSNSLEKSKSMPDLRQYESMPNLNLDGSIISYNSPSDKQVGPYGKGVFNKWMEFFKEMDSKIIDLVETSKKLIRQLSIQNPDPQYLEKLRQDIRDHNYRCDFLIKLFKRFVKNISLLERHKVPVPNEGFGDNITSTPNSPVMSSNSVEQYTDGYVSTPYINDEGYWSTPNSPVMSLNDGQNAEYNIAKQWEDNVVQYRNTLSKFWSSLQGHKVKKKTIIDAGKKVFDSKGQNLFRLTEFPNKFYGDSKELRNLWNTSCDLYQRVKQDWNGVAMFNETSDNYQHSLNDLRKVVEILFNNLKSLVDNFSNNRNQRRSVVDMGTSVSPGRRHTAIVSFRPTGI